MVWQTGGFLIPPAHDIRVPIWNNWVGRFLKRHMGISRVVTIDLMKQLTSELRDHNARRRGRS